MLIKTILEEDENTIYIRMFNIKQSFTASTFTARCFLTYSTRMQVSAIDVIISNH